MVQAIFWDFDGVIINSMAVRDKGFIEVLKKYDDKVGLLLEFHRKNGGLSRYVKFSYFFEEVLSDPSYGGKNLQFYTDQFSFIMKKLLTDKRLLIEDTLDFIKRCDADSIPMHIVSGSDGDELRYLCKKLEINHYFLSVDGSPTPKAELLGNLLTKYSYTPERCVLIGDSVNDYDAARINGVRFSGYNNDELRVLGSYIESFSKSTTDI